MNAIPTIGSATAMHDFDNRSFIRAEGYHREFGKAYSYNYFHNYRYQQFWFFVDVFDRPDGWEISVVRATETEGGSYPVAIDWRFLPLVEDKIRRYFQAVGILDVPLGDSDQIPKVIFRWNVATS